MSALEGAGFESWIVGGFVRDSLLGASPSDIDIATSADWTLASSVFLDRGWKVRETGTQHGTITVIVGADAFEVTTFRTDGPYHDARHPANVSFVQTIDEDLARRDFTFNALAYHPERGLHDPYGGLDDLHAGVIRAVGDPARRFHEDALRILRACRFVAQLGFSLEDSTLRGMLSNKGLLSRIANERILHELDRLLLSPFAGRALVETVDVISAVLPELVAMKGFDQRSPYHSYDVLTHTAYVVDGVPPYGLVRWAALFHDMGKPASFFLDDNGRGHFYGHGAVSALQAKGVMMRLGFSQAKCDRVLQLVVHHDDRFEASRRSVRRLISAFDGDLELAQALLELQRADAAAHAPEFVGQAAQCDLMLEILDELVAEGAAFSVRDLKINGRDVMALGIPQGPRVGRALDDALEAVIEGRVENERGALLAFLATPHRAEDAFGER